MTQTQDIVEVGTQVEDVQEMYEEEETNSRIPQALSSTYISWE